ncbi:PAS domain S-box protein [Deferribacter autotrophicus]|uniref:histidine kinase n=1 Tax=Deferribacter autotrophicus TaxID=500465 RepID=A0A5A8F7S9_9BACT|nr:PAS domain S-box protein [Deferribacter autotrophicus]KAA0258237.1 PAS domain S-box protein [Deferribacter autotrophicus]
MRLAIFLFLIIGSYIQCLNAEIKNIIKVGVYFNKPLIFVNSKGEPDGFFIDIIKEVARENNYQLKFINDKWPILFNKLKNGEIDILPCVAYGRERLEFFDFNKETIFTNWGMVFARKENAIFTVSDLQGKRVGVQKNDIHSKAVIDIIKNFSADVKFVYFDKYDEIINNIKNYKIYAGVVNKLVGYYLKDRDIVPTPIIFNPVQIKIASTKGKNEDFLKSIDKWIKNSKSDEVSKYYILYNKLFFNEINSEKNYWIFIIIIIGLITVFSGVYLILQRIIYNKTVELSNAYNSVNTILNSIKDAIFIHDPDGKVLDVNEGMLRMYKVNKEDALKCTIEDFSSGRMNMNKAREIWNEVVEKGYVEPFEWEARRPLDNALFDVEVLLTKVTYFGKTCILASVRDISERKKLLRKIEEESSRFQKYINLVQVIVLALDVNGNIIFINEKGAEILGYEIYELYGKNWLNNFILPKDREKVRDSFDKIINGELVLMEYYENYIIDRYGEKKLILWHNSLIKNHKGEIEAILSSGLDITNERKFLNDLILEKSKFNIMLESIGDGVIAIDRQRKIILFNKMAENITFLNSEEAIGKKLDDFLIFVESELVLDELFNKVEKYGRYHSETRLKNKQGKEITIEYVITKMQDENSNVTGYMLIFKDITKEKMIEEEMLRIEKLKSLSYLAAGIAHDFNNLLAAIINNIHLMEIYLKDKKINEIDNIISSVKKVLDNTKGLTKQLLTFSKGGEPVLKVESIKELIEQTATFLLRGSKVKLKIICNDGIYYVKMDKDQISQVLQNIIVNALDVMKDGGIIEISCQNTIINDDIYPVKKGKYVKISIKDSGPGIPNEVLDKIFDPFFTTKETGNGLGLAISHSIVMKHKGYMSVETELGVGTTFHIYLPAAEEKENMQSKEEYIDDIDGAGKRILIMDDEESIRDSFKLILECYNFTVDCVRDGDEALKLLRQSLELNNLYDTVFLDVTIPGGKGAKDVIDEINKLSRKLKTVVISGYSDDPILTNYQEYGFDFAVAKPFDLNEIEKILNESKY